MRVSFRVFVCVLGLLFAVAGPLAAEETTLQGTWALDLNYSPSFDMLRERGYVEWIEGRLPRDGETRSLLKDLEERIRRRRTSLPE